MIAEQVFRKLSGILLIGSLNSEDSTIPNEYSVNEIALIFQDRLFDDDKQPDYDNLMNEDRTLGDISMIDGTLNSQLSFYSLSNSFL